MGAWLALVPGIAVFALFAYLMLMSRETKNTGPALTGTARVLTVKRMGSAQGNYPARSVLRIGLRVQIPGRGPYDVIVRQNIVPWDIPAIGESVPVQVEAANPQDVRIGLGAPRTTQVSSELTSFPARRFPANPIQVRSAAEVLASGQRVRGRLSRSLPPGRRPAALAELPANRNCLTPRTMRSSSSFTFRIWPLCRLEPSSRYPSHRCPAWLSDSNSLARWTRLTPNCASSTGTPSPTDQRRVTRGARQCSISFPSLTPGISAARSRVGFGQVSLRVSAHNSSSGLTL